MDNGNTQVQIPRLEPGSHLRLNNPWPLFRFCFTLGAISDAMYKQMHKIYEPASVDSFLYLRNFSNIRVFFSN